MVGEGWDRIALPANVELARKTDCDGLFRLAGQAKICKVCWRSPQAWKRRKNALRPPSYQGTRGGTEFLIF